MGKKEGRKLKIESLSLFSSLFLLAFNFKSKPSSLQRNWLKEKNGKNFLKQLKLSGRNNRKVEKQ
jgi:hypothetical protein